MFTIVMTMELCCLLDLDNGDLGEFTYAYFDLVSKQIKL